MLWTANDAIVYQGICKFNGHVVSVKKMTNSTFTKESFEAFKREIYISIHTRHFAFVPFIGFSVCDPFYIVSKFMSGRSLFQGFMLLKTLLGENDYYCTGNCIQYSILHARNH